MNNIYKISQYKNVGYDTYDSAIVVASSKQEAATIYPGGKELWGKPNSSWCSDPKDIEIKYIGTTGLPIGSVILASYNAG